MSLTGDSAVESAGDNQGVVVESAGAESTPSGESAGAGESDGAVEDVAGSAVAAPAPSEPPAVSPKRDEIRTVEAPGDEAVKEPSLEDLKAAAELRFQENVKSQSQAGIDWKSVHSCVRWDKPTNEVATIITSPAHANCVDEKNGNYPLHIAAQNGHINLVKWLVQNGADINAQNGTGTTALHMR